MEELLKAIEDVLDWEFHLLTTDDADGRQLYFDMKKLEEAYNKYRKEQE